MAAPNTKPPTAMKKKILQENLDQLNKSLLQAASSLSGDSGITMEQLDSLVKTYLASKQLIERPNGNSIPVPSAESLLSTPSSREVIENYTAGHDDLPKDSSVESITQSNEYVQKIFSSGDQAKSGPVLPEALLEKLATDIISKVDNHLDSKFQKMEEKYSNEHSELVKCVSTSLSTIKTGQEQNIKLQSQMTDFHKALNEIKQKQMETESLIRNKVCEDNSAKEISREIPTQTSNPESREIGTATHDMTKKGKVLSPWRRSYILLLYNYVVKVDLIRSFETIRFLIVLFGSDLDEIYAVKRNSHVGRIFYYVNYSISFYQN